MTFFTDINKNLAYLAEYIKLNTDCKLRRIMSGQTECAVVFLESTVSQQLLEDSVFARLMQIAVQAGSMDSARRSATSGGQLKPVKQLEDCPDELAGGMTLLFINGIAGCLSIDIRSLPSRSTEEPSLDKTIIGARDGFTEAVMDNLALIRKRIRVKELCVHTVFVGSGKAKCFLIHLGKSRAALAKKVEAQLKKLDDKMCLSLGDIAPVLSVKTIFPMQKTTERADTACSLISKGKLIMIMDGQPIAICMPATLFEMFESPNDASLAKPLAKSAAALRYFGAFLCVILPGLYVALLNFNRALLPPEIINLVIEAESRIALPLIPEVLVTWILVGLVFQVGVSLPTTVGGTIGIFGSIVLGQALINANIASEITLLVIITAAISGYAVPNYPLSNALRPISLFVLLLSAVLGITGTGLALIVVLARLFTLSSAGEAYLPLKKKKNFITAKELEAGYDEK